MRRILVINPELKTRNIMINTLQQAGYEVLALQNTANASDIVRTYDHLAVVICDISVLHTYKANLNLLAQRHNTSLILLTENPPSHSLDGIEQNVAVISKPLQKQALLSAVLNSIVASAEREAVQATKAFISANFTVFLANLNHLPMTNDPSSATVKRALSNASEKMSQVRELMIYHERAEAVYRNQSLTLTPTEFGILQLLVQSAGRVVTSEALLYALQNVTVSRNEARRILSAHITHLRMKMREVGCDHYLINSRGRGYMIDNDAEAALERKEAQLHLLLDQIPILLWNVDGQLQFISITGDFVLGALGRTSDDVTGMSLYDFFSSAEAPIIQAHRQALEGTASAYEIEWRHRIYQGYVQPIYENQAIVGCTGVALDITERKSNEIELYKLKQAIESSTVGVTLTDANLPDMPLVYTNPAFERIAGYSSQEVIGKNCRFLQHDDRDQVGIKTLREALRNGTGCTVVIRNYRKDGTLFWNQLTVSPVHNPAGELTYFVGIQKDVTEVKQLEQTLAENEQRYRIISEALSHYTYGLRVAPDGQLQQDWIGGDMASITGFTPEELNQRGGWASILYADDLPVAVQRLQRLLSGQDDTSEFRIVTASNEIRWLRDYGHPIWNETEQRIIYIVGAAQDITHSKQTT